MSYCRLAGGCCERIGGLSELSRGRRDRQLGLGRHTDATITTVSRTVCAAAAFVASHYLSPTTARFVGALPGVPGRECWIFTLPHLDTRPFPSQKSTPARRTSDPNANLTLNRARMTLTVFN